MHPKYIFLLLFLPVILSNNITAQITHLGLDMGYGTYEMSENKDVIESAMSANVLQPHCVSNFPGYLFFRPYIEIEYQYLNIGVAYTLLSTGSRYSIYDYSGEYKFDAQITGHTVAAFAETPIYSFKRLKFLVAVESGVIFNNMKLNERFQLTDTYNQQDEYGFESINYFLKPYLKAEYGIWKRLSANIVVGYHKDLKADKMHLEDDDTSVSEFVANWDGIRTSIGIAYRLD